MPCQITIDDGTTEIILDNTQLSFALRMEPVEGGASIVRFLDGGAAKQTRWAKTRLSVSGSDKAPSGLLDLDYSLPLDVEVLRGGDTLTFTCIAVGVEEGWLYSDGKAEWELVMEET
jgi:hypothetical protein